MHVRGIDQASQAYERGEAAGFYGPVAMVETLARQFKRPAAIVFPQSLLALASRPPMH